MAQQLESSSTYRNSTHLSQTSVAAVHEIVQCAIQIATINGTGFVAFLDKINDDRKSFAVRLAYKTGGDPTWKLTQFDVQPPDPAFKCSGGFQKASNEHPITFAALTQEIVCAKSPNRSLTLVAATTAGAAPAIALTSVNEEIQKLRDDTASQIQALEASTSSQIKELQDKLNALQPAIVKLDNISVDKNRVQINSGLAHYDFPSDGNFNFGFAPTTVCGAANDKARPNATDLTKCFK